MDRDLIPDVVAAGGLVPALRQAGAELGVNVTVEADGAGARIRWEGQDGAVVRDPLQVELSAKERTFFTTGMGPGRGVELVSGTVTGLGNVVRLAAAWGQGVALSHLHAQFPGTYSSKLALAHEQGLEAVLALQWQMLHDQAAEEESFAAFGELVRAAYAEPRLRRLSAFTSHWVLGFSTSVHPRARPVIALGNKVCPPCAGAAQVMGPDWPSRPAGAHRAVN
ncbi:DUF6193 family natural product biosynthesis protein [Streptomyces sp. NPDC001941]|uniref:DUF6193 family natural product biosynthesis protein n=1 Tax=Streptomyces sp. NPDC001941 TaxID=3154659 RepID=UPI0033307D81